MHHTSTSERLRDISDLPLAEMMSTEVLTAYEGWSIKRLAGFFVRHNISGAPVVASDDSLVGVVTQADVVRFESRTPSDAEIQKVAHFYHGPNSPGLTRADIERLKERAIQTCTVNTIMTPRVHSLDVSTCAAQACRFMVEEGIHRLFLTSEGRVIGVVTAMDFLRRMTNG
jgi:predicted transcriptional regulator